METEILKHPLNKNDEAYNEKLYKELHCICGFDEFRVSQAGYRTVVTCVVCGKKYVAHEG
jgi:hypothetical protein